MMPLLACGKSLKRAAQDPENGHFCGRKGSQTELIIMQHEILELKESFMSMNFVTLYTFIYYILFCIYYIYILYTFLDLKREGNLSTVV